MPNPLETAWNEHLASTQGVDGGETANSGVTAKDRAQDYWNGGNIFGDWFGHQDSFAHNEALAAYQREKEASKEAFEREANFNASAARENREWEKMMSDTAFQRKVADYKAAGFSPLAALEGAVGATSPVAPPPRRQVIRHRLTLHPKAAITSDPFLARWLPPLPLLLRKA